MNNKNWTNGLSIPIKYIGLFDRINYAISYYIGYWFYNIGISPNMITLMGLIFNIIASYGILINKDYYIIFIPLATLFDCMDGFNARMFNQCSKYGTLIDHTADWLSAIFLISSSIYSYHNLPVFWILFIMFCYLQTFNFLYCGYIQQYNGKKDIALSRILQKYEKKQNRKLIETKLYELKEYCSSNQAIFILFVIRVSQYFKNL